MIDVTQLPEEEAAAVYAIGDIHGRLDLLAEIEAAIAHDAEANGLTDFLVCYLGDYIDRGPHSAQVIERLCSPSTNLHRRAFLKGNHEDRMLDFLADPVTNGPGWMKFGGAAALESYGIGVPAKPRVRDWTNVRDGLAAALPETHRDWLSALRLAVRWRGYLMVHAGFDPTRPMSAQDEHDLMWIRDAFFNATCDWGFKVVHGHVANDAPVFRPNRICIDTGAYKTGRLTCLVLHDGIERLLQS